MNEVQCVVCAGPCGFVEDDSKPVIYCSYSCAGVKFAKEEAAASDVVYIPPVKVEL